MNNVFGNLGFYWWIGVVENRKDPLKLGRYQVRIFGYNNPNKTEQPTSELPWAIPIQPVFSSAISGKGTSSNGLLEGTWVAGFYADGEDKQQPFILGSIAAAPISDITQQNLSTSNQTETQESFLKDRFGNVVADGEGNPIKIETFSELEQSDLSEFPPLTKTDLQNLIDAIGFKESSSVKNGVQNYSAENQFGFIGKYQFGALALQTLGYLKAPVGKTLKNADLKDASNWSGKSSLNSIEDYFKSSKVQEEIMIENLRFNYKILKKKGALTASSNKSEVAGLLATAHLLGAGGAIKLKAGQVGKDGNGVSGDVYYNLGSKAVGGDGETITPLEPQEAPDIIVSSPKAFSDPTGVYPTREYSDGRGDINKLARGDSNGTIVDKKDALRTTNISIANGQGEWSEPPPAFCAQYPFNHVTETESGHIVEYDDTPGNERLHIYHKKGTYIEIDVNGTSVRKVVGDNYEIFERNNKVFVRGSYDVTVDGIQSLLVKGSSSVQIMGDANIVVNNNAFLDVAGDYNLNVGGEFNLKSNGINITSNKQFQSLVGEMFDVKSNTINLDASEINYNSGSASGQGSGLGSPVQKLNVSNKALVSLLRPACSKVDIVAYGEDEGGEGAIAYRQNQIDNGIYEEEEINQVAKEGDSENIDKNNPVLSVVCEDLKQFKEFVPSIKLSRFFNLGQLSSNSPVIRDEVVDQVGLKKIEIVCNLKNLAINCLDPIKQKYPNLVVTNAFRAGSGQSQHFKGQAADLQFTGATNSEYFEIAKWIRDNVPHDQLLLEYKTTGSKLPWIHISFNPEGNRRTNKTATFLNHAKYSNGLTQLG